MKNGVKIVCDSIKIRAPLADGSGQLTFGVGEYQLETLVEIFKKFNGKVFTLIIEDLHGN